MLKATIYLLALFQSAFATTAPKQGAIHLKRGAEKNATLYCYSNDNTAWSVAYGLDDHLLYMVKSTPNTTDDTYAALRWDLASITSEDWIANATFVNGTEAGSLCINEDDSLSVLPLGTGVGEKGDAFALFATQLVYNNDTYLESQFWAAPTEKDDLYKLVWVEDDAAVVEGSFPAVLKGVEDS